MNLLDEVRPGDEASGALERVVDVGAEHLQLRGKATVDDLDVRVATRHRTPGVRLPKVFCGLDGYGGGDLMGQHRGRRGRGGCHCCGRCRWLAEDGAGDVVVSGLRGDAELGSEGDVQRWICHRGCHGRCSGGRRWLAGDFVLAVWAARRWRAMRRATTPGAAPSVARCGTVSGAAGGGHGSLRGEEERRKEGRRRRGDPRPGTGAAPQQARAGGRGQGGARRRPRGAPATAGASLGRSGAE